MIFIIHNVLTFYNAFSVLETFQMLKMEVVSKEIKTISYILFFFINYNCRSIFACFYFMCMFSEGNLQFVSEIKRIIILLIAFY